jgi:hypothetical protein
MYGEHKLSEESRKANAKRVRDQLNLEHEQYKESKRKLAHERKATREQERTSTVNKEQYWKEYRERHSGERQAGGGAKGENLLSIEETRNLLKGAKLNKKGEWIPGKEEAAAADDPKVLAAKERAEHKQIDEHSKAEASKLTASERVSKQIELARERAEQQQIADQSKAEGARVRKEERERAKVTGPPELLKGLDREQSLLIHLQNMSRKNRQPYLQRLMAGGISGGEEWMGAAGKIQGQVGPEGHINRTLLQRFQDVMVWRLFRTAAMIAVGFVIKDIAQSWFKVGFGIAAANQESQALNRTWGTSANYVKAIAQGLGRAAVNIVQRNPVQGFLSDSAAKWQAWDEASKKFPKGPWRSLGFWGEYQRRTDYLSSHPEQIRAKEMPGEVEKARYAWATQQAKSTPFGQGTRVAVREAAQAYKDATAKILKGTRPEYTALWYQRKGDLTTAEVALRQAKADEKFGVTLNKLAAKEEHLTGVIEARFPGLATAAAYKERRAVMQVEVTNLRQMRDLWEPYSNEWVEADKKLNATLQKLLPTPREVMRMTMGLTAEQMTKAGVTEGYLAKKTGWASAGYPVSPGPARMADFSNRNELMVRFGNLTPEDQRLLLQKMGTQMIHRFRAQNSDWGGGVGGR